MDVQVKLWLQGGHMWEFCCDEEDPALFGLMAAAPSASVSKTPPSDGLIKLTTRNGERLLLSPASIISVEVAPISDKAHVSDSRRLVAEPPQALYRLTSPAFFAMVPNALPQEMHRALLRHALAQEDAVHRQGRNGVCELNLSPMQEAVARVLRSHVYRSRTKLGVSELPVANIRFGFYAIGHGKSLSLNKENEDSLYLIYQFHAQPKSFTGGGLRLFDCGIGDDGQRAAHGFRDIEIDDNNLLIFPSHVVSAGLPVFCASRAFADRLFALSASIRLGGARE